MLEINSAPDRRDLNDVHARAAAAAGVRILINSDAHGAEHARHVRWGVATARRAWLGPRRRGEHAAVEGVRRALRKRAKAAPTAVRPRSAAGTPAASRRGSSASATHGVDRGAA